MTLLLKENESLTLGEEFKEWAELLADDSDWIVTNIPGETSEVVARLSHLDLLPKQPLKEWGGKSITFQYWSIQSKNLIDHETGEATRKLFTVLAMPREGCWVTSSPTAAASMIELLGMSKSFDSLEPRTFKVHTPKAKSGNAFVKFTADCGDFWG